jgi:hypothetical protein
MDSMSICANDCTANTNNKFGIKKLSISRMNSNKKNNNCLGGGIQSVRGLGGNHSRHGSRGNETYRGPERDSGMFVQKLTSKFDSRKRSLQSLDASSIVG